MIFRDKPTGNRRQFSADQCTECAKNEDLCETDARECMITVLFVSFLMFLEFEFGVNP